MSNYNHRLIHQKILEKHQQKNHFYCDVYNLNRTSYYCLAMFPYPSGSAHMGHVRVYTLADVEARYRKLKGYEVLHPIGWDAFGLPAENAAIKNKVRPDIWTQENIRKMKYEQLGPMGWSHDWDKEINTSSPDYYKWTQWLFVQLFKHDKVYRKESYVNWCEVDQTILANEQVINGRCWRDQSIVIKKKMPQWFIKITDYADKLWQDLNKLEQWPTEALAIQRNWIGKSEGTQVFFHITDSSYPNIEIFTTRVDTLFGVTALVLAPEHPIVETYLNAHPEDRDVANYVSHALKKNMVERLQTKEKSGVSTKLKARHPFKSESDPYMEVPVWIADYVIGDYGTGAVMCVPMHDERDHEFASVHKLPKIPVIQPTSGESIPENQAWTLDGVLINSGEFSGLSSEKARIKMTEALTHQGKGRAVTLFQLKDWSVGRQRYWGCPIPIIHCPQCGPVPVPENQLPVLLPDSTFFENDLTHPHHLQHHDDFKKTNCPTCGGPAERETDTLDTFMCSAWYLFRFVNPDNAEKIFNTQLVNRWMPVDFYVGGLEHAAQHMIYLRFMTKFLYDIGLISFDEPVKTFFCNGMVRKNGFKMSKSKGNVVVPTDMIEQYGPDALRMYILSDTPAQIDFDWDDKGMQAKFEFTQRIYHHLHSFLHETRLIKPIETTQELEGFTRQNLLFDFYELIKNITFELENHHYHNLIARLYELHRVVQNIMEEGKGTSHNARVARYLIKEYLIILSLVAPFLSEYLLNEFYDENLNIFEQKYPSIPDAYQNRLVQKIAVQINGKVRGLLESPTTASESEVIQQAHNHPQIQKYLKDKTILKTIYVPHKILSFVVKD